MRFADLSPATRAAIEKLAASFTPPVDPVKIAELLIERILADEHPDPPPGPAAAIALARTRGPTG